MPSVHFPLCWGQAPGGQCILVGVLSNITQDMMADELPAIYQHHSWGMVVALEDSGSLPVPQH